MLIMLAVDETDEAIEAARQARQLFGADATYLAVNVADEPAPWMAGAPRWGAVYAHPHAATYPLVEEEVAPPVADPPPTTEARRTAHQVSDEADVDAVALGEVGDPTTVIIGAAEAHGADVIVVGASEKGWFRRMIAGSVSNQLAHVSPIPVLIAGQSAADHD